jgi:hypothetical protein
MKCFERLVKDLITSTLQRKMRAYREEVRALAE